nr:protein HASTY 1-like isoform X3 [Coffea arabica]
MEDSGMVNNVAAALAAALDWRSSGDARKAAYSYLESVKAGDIRHLANASFTLVKKDWSSEIRLQAFKMLQHLVRLRWDELNPTEKRNFAKMAVDLMSEMANPSEEWALKSQTAALVAEVVRREGVSLWQELLPSLISLSNQGPTQAEIVSMMLRWLPEDVMVHNEDLEGDRRRLLLRGLTESLPDILPLLYSLLERHFGAALAEASRQQSDIVKQHAATVTATLNAVNAYADYGSDLPEYITESMVFLGSSNLQSVAGDAGIVSSYLQQMLGFFQHCKLALHCQSLLFWLALMRDLVSKSKIFPTDNTVEKSNSSSGQADIEKKKILAFVNDDIFNAILDASFQRMLKKEKVHPHSAFLVGTLELWSDDFEGKGDFGQYRSRLLELIRFVASEKPLIAATKISERINAIVKSLLLAPTPAQELATMESMQLPLENVAIAVFDGSNDFGRMPSEVQLALCRIFEGLLQQLLSLKWIEPALVQVLGRYLDALGPFLKHHPDAAGTVINKLFELLTSLPLIVKDPSVSAARHARLQICTSFIRIAKAADKSLLPHMKGIADTMAYLQKEGTLLRGEHNLLAEAFLIMAASAGVQQQQQVLAWLLEPLSKQWTQVEWQEAYLSEPAGLVRLCAETSFMWSLFHTVTFFERALKRSGVRKGNFNLQNISTALHPMASHISWMLPPLLKLLRAVHSLWSPSVAQALPAEVKGAMIMSDVERTSLLGEGSLRLPRSALTFSDGSQLDMHKEGHSEPTEIDIRNWLKGIRDSGYNVLGLSATVEDSFFKYLDSDSIALALMENIQSMEFRHIRQLVHSSIIPLVRCCPSDLWEGWMEKLLHPLLFHSQRALSSSWSSLLQEGHAKVPDLHGIPAGSDLKVEVMEEKLLRDLTREICSLLSVLASSGLNSGLPSLEQSGQVARVDVSNLKGLDAFVSSSMVGFLLNHKSLALPALQISLEAFRWTDAEAVTKVAFFCGAVVLLSIVTNNADIQEFVCKHLFSAIIQGLALESNAIINADLVGLCREIFIYLSDRDPAPREILLSLPCITQQDFLAFQEALSKTSSPKEQKQHMKSFLLLATGNQLKALASQKSATVISNVSGRPRNLGPAPESNLTDGGDAIGLAAIM